MNVFLKKEIRLLLPNFAVACVLALSNLVLREQPEHWTAAFMYVVSMVACPAAVIMLTLSSFGVEVNSGTLAGLLAQPISRQKIWDTKIGLLATALLGVAVLWSVTMLIDIYVQGRINGAHAISVVALNMLTVGGSFALVTFTGGLWTVLLLRQVASAFWITLLAPGALLVVLIAFIADSDENFITGMVVTVMGLYSLAGFFFARWLFFRAQDLQWSGGNIEMPELRDLAWFRMGTKAARGWHPRAALWRKELMLHQSQLIMAFVLAVLHLGVLATRHLMDMHRHRDLEFVLSIFWGLWLVMPLLVGCAAVAEERKLGTLEGQLCLSASRQSQFFIKFAVMLGLSLLLGVIVPLLFEGTRIIPGTHFGMLSLPIRYWDHMSFGAHLLWLCAATVVNLAPLLLLVFIAAAIGTISFLASSLARNTLQTLGPSVLGIMSCWGLVAGFVTQSNWGRSYYHLLWQGPLPFIIGIPLMGITILWLAYRNFNHVRPHLRLIGANVAVLVGAVLATAVLSSAIYHRCWEKLTPFEPAHGSAKLARDGTTKFVIENGEFLVTLPDGKRLTAGLAATQGARNPVTQMLGNQRATLSNWRVLGSTNWLVLHHSFRDIAGIKPDGTLWVAPWRTSHVANLGVEANDLVQFGSETNWNSLAGYYSSMLLTKTDGTLWLWAADDRDYENFKKPWPGLSHFTPRRLGTDSDWAEVRQMGSLPWLKKNDSYYFFSTENWGATQQRAIEIDSNLVVYPVVDAATYQTPNLVTLYYMYSERLRVDPDGVFRIVAGQEYQRGPHGKYYDWIWKPRDLPIGHETNWLAAAGEGDKAVTLKKDGTLWLWEFSYGNYPPYNRSESDIQKTVPVQLGTHSDWISIAEFDSNSLITLAADGSLWYWPLVRIPDYYYSSDSDRQNHVPPILDVSRKPQLLGNVFDAGS